jgi:hypothetical protein
MERALSYEPNDFMPIPRRRRIYPTRVPQHYEDNIEWASTLFGLFIALFFPVGTA